VNRHEGVPLVIFLALVAFVVWLSVYLWGDFSVRVL
jgi:hypothetical protein